MGQIILCFDLIIHVRGNRFYKMQVTFQPTKYYSSNQNTTFGADAYFLTTRKMYAKMQQVPFNKQETFMRAIEKIKTYFTGCKICKTKEYAGADIIRHFFLKLPDSRKIKLPLIDINHRWQADNIIAIGNKLEELSVQYPEYNPHIAKYIKKHERWSFKICK